MKKKMTTAQRYRTAIEIYENNRPPYRSLSAVAITASCVKVTKEFVHAKVTIKFLEDGYSEVYDDCSYQRKALDPFIVTQVGIKTT
jgi:hypothetical protein